MFQSILLLLSIALSLVLGDQLNFSKKSTKKCTLQLEGIVYQPETCAFKYFQRITEDLRVKSPLLWTPQAKSLFDAFSLTYNVEIFVVDAFGKISRYPNDPNENESDIAQTFVFQRLNTARGALITVDKAYIYGSIFWNANGEMYYVVVAAPMKRFVSIC